MERVCSRWNQTSQIWTHAHKYRFFLMSIPCVCWPKTFSSCCCASHSWLLCSNLTMKAWFTQSPLHSWCWDVASLWRIYLGTNLRCCSFAVSETGNFNAFTLGQSSWEPVSSQCLMVFMTAVEDTLKEIFQIDWPSYLKVMMDCHSLTLAEWFLQ